MVGLASTATPPAGRGVGDGRAQGVADGAGRRGVAPPRACPRGMVTGGGRDECGSRQERSPPSPSSRWWRPSTDRACGWDT